MKKLSVGLLVICVLFVGSVTQAQEWGEIQPYEWHAMPPDEYASLGAAVIFDKGLATTEQNGLKLERHVRSILLGKSGIDLIGKITIECYEYDHLNNLRAQVLSADGTVRELSDKQFTRRETDSKQFTTITFPDLKPGDIVEYAYELDYYGGYDKLGAEKYFLFSQEKRFDTYQAREVLQTIDWDDKNKKQVTNIPSWFFDNPVYTFSSEFSAKIGGDIDYIFFTTNLPPDRIPPTVKSIRILSAPVYKRHSWYMENIPPFVRDTAQIVEAEAQRKAIHFRLFSTDGENRIMAGTYSDTHWQLVGESFQGYMLEYVKTGKGLRRKARSLTADQETEMDKLEALYDYIVAELTVDPSGHDLRPLNTTLKQLYRKKKGKPFELNLMLVEMLKIAGLKAAPILISTREKISFRKSGRFNHMITRVEIDGEDMLVDVSSTECPLGKLPKVSMVTEGVGIDFDNSKPCQIVPIGCE